MKESRKFYYIDENGNKKKYIGKIIFDNGSYNGILTTPVKEEVKKELIYYPEIKGVDGYSSYYTYMNENGEEEVYLDVVKKDSDGNLYFNKTEKNIYKLVYHPKIEAKEEYYTYLDKDGNECRYSGKVTYERMSNSYFGFLPKK